MKKNKRSTLILGLFLTSFLPINGITYAQQTVEKTTNKTNKKGNKIKGFSFKKLQTALESEYNKGDANTFIPLVRGTYGIKSDVILSALLLYCCP